MKAVIIIASMLLAQGCLVTTGTRYVQREQARRVISVTALPDAVEGRVDILALTRAIQAQNAAQDASGPFWDAPTIVKGAAETVLWGLAAYMVYDNQSGGGSGSSVYQQTTSGNNVIHVGDGTTSTRRDGL